MPCISVQFNPAIGPILNIGFGKAKGIRQTINKAAAQGQRQAISTFPLLVDTGASTTCISPQVVNQVGLRTMGKKPAGVASGPVELNTYLVDIVVLFGNPQKGSSTMYLIEGLLVMEFGGDTINYHGLLGRDVICKGFFSMEAWANRFTFCI